MSRPRQGFTAGHFVFLIVLGMLFFLVPVSPGEAAEVRIGAASDTDVPHASDHVLVELAPGTDVITALGDDTEAITGRWRTYPVPAGMTPIETVEALAARPDIQTAELDYRVKVEPIYEQTPVDQGGVDSLSVNDPFYQYQWHLPAVQTDDAWSLSTGDDVVVAVLDSGISQGGVDLDCHTFIDPYNAITQTTGAAAATDDNGHGTHVAGTVAQCTNNGVGVAGMAFDASLMPVKVLDDEGEGDFSWIARGIDWAKDNGADVINMSLGCEQPCSSTLMNAAIDSAHDTGIVIVAASGNDGVGAVAYPASHSDVIAVGATDFNKGRAPYSNWGSALDVVAPGGDVFQDVNNDGFGDGVLQETFVGSTWDYWFFEGTSMATPHVAGAAALLRSVDPTLNPGQVQQILQDSALDLGATGFDTTYGHGLIRICEAVGSVAPTWLGGAELDATDLRATSVRLTWPLAIDDACSGGYQIYQGNTLIKTLDSSVNATTISGLTPATDYTFRVRALDPSGNLSQPLSVEVTTLDSIAPKWSTQAELSVVSYGETSLKVAWDAATDNVGVTGYRLMVDGDTVATLTGRHREVTGLTPGTSYLFEVVARDLAGNWSGPLPASLSTALAFLDTSGHTFYGDILWMSGSGVTRGCNPPVNDLFCPDDPVTRGQMSAFLVRALGLTANTHSGFDDVPASSTFANDIGRLATAGITRGCNPPTNDLFCPEDPVTRGQLAAFLRRALG